VALIGKKNYQPIRHNIQEEKRPQLNCSRSSKSHMYLGVICND